jgi:hypothetical protein
LRAFALPLQPLLDIKLNLHSGLGQLLLFLLRERQLVPYIPLVLEQLGLLLLQLVGEL